MENEDNTGIEHAENGDVIGTGNDARLKLYEQIADSSDVVRSDEFMDINDDGSVSQFQAGEEDEEQRAAREDLETERFRAEAEAQSRVANPRMKVNGVDVELTPEMLERASKVAAADAYLAEAARIRGEVQAAPQYEQPTYNEPNYSAAPSSEEELKALARALQMGTEEEAAEGLRRLIMAGPSKDDIARTIDDRLTFKEAISKFNTEYTDLMGNPTLRKMVLDRDAEMIATGDRRPYYDRYKDIGDNVRNFVKEISGAAPVTPELNKTARKLTIVNTPKPASGKSQNVVEEEQEESARDIIASMAKSRGAPPWMQGR